jgi:cardiolipin synthase
LDAYRGNDQYFLRYRRGANIYYAAGDLKGELPAPAPIDDLEYDTPTVAPMESLQQQSWDRITSSLTPVPILGVNDWANLRSQLFKGLIPTAPNQGVAISFDRMDYFFFYDKTGTFRARRLIEKPPWYSVAARINLREHFERWQPQLQAFLEQAGIEGDDVIFSTGDLDRGSIPFLYINMRAKLIVLVMHNDLPDSMAAAVPGGHVIQGFWHFLRSHTYTRIMRPFSSLQSLLALATDTALETGRTLTTGLGRPSEPLPGAGQEPPMDLVAWEAYLDERLGRPASQGNLRFLVDGEAFFQRFIDTVTSAEESVDIRAYIFDNDDVAMNVAELLKRRSLEGIDVRVLVDGLGTVTSYGERSESEPPEHRAPLSIRTHLEQGSRVRVRVVQNPWLTGDHVKTMVIDREVAFLGGMNIGREYRYDWHDLMVEVTGPVVDQINREFRTAWGAAGPWGDFSRLTNWADFDRNRNLDSGGYPVRLIHTKPGRQEIFALQREAIRRSQNYIYIENAYFTDDSLLKELVLARRRGVDVRVIIPLETDRGLITRNIVLAANTMLENGVRVFIYPGFSHAKAAIFDGWASVGSANLDRLSLRINREINIATSEPSAIAALQEQLFDHDFAASREMTEPFRERWSDQIIEMFGDYLF